LRAGREEASAAWRDAQDAAHAAHASDPWVLDGCPPWWNWDRALTKGLFRDDRDLSPDGSG
jgi:hypothetical protein